MQSYRFALRLIGPAGIEVVEVAGPVIANDMHLARQLVEQGAGLGPFIFPPGEHRSLGKALVRVLPDYIIEGPKLYVATATRKSLPLRVRLLREFLVNAYAARSLTCATPVYSSLISSSRSDSGAALTPSDCSRYC